MALNFDFKKVKNWERVCWAETGETDENGKELMRLAPITDALIWGLLEIGIGKITQENWKEVWLRLACADMANEGRGRIYERQPDGPTTFRLISSEEVHAHIGLSTNVSRITPIKFYNLLLERAVRNLREPEMVTTH